jgi:hypothetical protein
VTRPGADAHGLEDVGRRVGLEERDLDGGGRVAGGKGQEGQGEPGEPEGAWGHGRAT